MTMLPVQPAHRLADRPEQQSWLVTGLWADEAVGIIGGRRCSVPRCRQSRLQLTPRLPSPAGSLVPGNLEALATAVELQHKVFRFGVPRLEVAKHNRIIFVGHQDKRIVGPKLQFGRFAETGQRQRIARVG